MNLGKARFAGETVRLQLHLNNDRTQKQQNPNQKHGPARHGTHAPPGQEPRDTGTEEKPQQDKCSITRQVCLSKRISEAN